MKTAKAVYADVILTVNRDNCSLISKTVCDQSINKQILNLKRLNNTRITARVSNRNSVACNYAQLSRIARKWEEFTGLAITRK